MLIGAGPGGRRELDVQVSPQRVNVVGKVVFEIHVHQKLSTRRRPHRPWNELRRQLLLLPETSDTAAEEMWT